jgi:hypothetical protein
MKDREIEEMVAEDDAPLVKASTEDMCQLTNWLHLSP